MTVAEQNTQATYTGNGVATFFEFETSLILDAELVVYVESVVVTNYSIQLTGINFDTPPANGARIRITRESDITQERDWEPHGKFPAEKTENAADKLIRLKGEAQEFRGNMNLSLIRTIGDVTLVNDKGNDAITPLWHHTLQESGMFSATVATQIPLDGTPTDTPESHAWFMCDPGSPNPPPTMEYSTAPETGFVLLDSQFTGDMALVRNRTHPMAGYAEQDLTIFGAFRWTPAGASVGALFDIGGISIDAVRRPLTSQYYIGFTFREQGGSEIFGNTFELGNLEDGGNAYTTGDWLAFAISVSRFDIAPPDGQRNFTGYVANLTKGTEQNFSYEPVGTGLLGWEMGRDRTGDSRAGVLEYMDEDGSTTFLGPVSMMGFDFVYMDLELESERDKIWTLSGMSDHGLAGVNVFGRRGMYYSLPGAPSLNQGYMNFGDPRLTEPVVFGTGADLPPTNFTPYEHALADWVYDDMAAAEASGDAWQNDDTVFIMEGGQRMKYRTALAVSGHSGLFHIDPHMIGTDYTTVTVRANEDEGTDPQTWGWTLNTTGTEGVDWVADLDAGRGRISALTNAGAIDMRVPYNVIAGDEDVFCILDRYTSLNNNNTIGVSTTLQCLTTRNLLVSNNGSAIPPTPPSQTHGVFANPDYANTLWDEETEKRVWMYQNNEYSSIWDDTGMILKLPAVVSALIPEILRHVGGTAGENGPQDVRLGYQVIGTLA
jgi:hypothetical protein